MSICYLVGDATYPIGVGKKIIMHICNDIGGWGSGFVLAVSKRWKEPEEMYRSLARQCPLGITLGVTMFVSVQEDIVVANMIGQHGMQWGDGGAPIRYDALRTTLGCVRRFAIARNATVHAPRIGAGLAGGDWKIIEQIINEELCDHGVEVTVYDLLEPEDLSAEINRRIRNE